MRLLTEVLASSPRENKEDTDFCLLGFVGDKSVDNAVRNDIVFKSVPGIGPLIEDLLDGFVGQLSFRWH